MKTIKTEKSGSHTLVIGFDNASIDPVSTQEKVKTILSGVPEFKAVQNKAEEMQALADMAGKAKANSKMLAAKGDEQQAAIEHQIFLKRNEGMRAKELELMPLLEELENRKREVYKNEAVYFEPRKGEVFGTVAEINAVEDALNGLKENEALALNADNSFKVILDFRKAKYAVKVSGVWERGEISLAGENLPPKAILEADLTQAQKDEIDLQFLQAKIAAMTTAQKADALAAVDASLIEQAVAMRNKLEIQGVTTALADSQAWYQAELAKAQLLYA